MTKRTFVLGGFFKMKSLQKKHIERIVCSGGGAKGIIYPGAYQGLLDSGVLKHVNQFAGSSAGAITATFMALGMSVDVLRLQALNTDLKKMMGKSISPLDLRAPGITALLTKDGQPLETFVRENIIKTVRSFIEQVKFNKTQENAPHYASLQQLISKFNDPKLSITFGDLAILNEFFPDHFKKLTITAAHFPNGELQIFNAEKTPSVEIALACRASASIPVVLKPVEIEMNGKLHSFIDGGFYDNIPTDYFDIGADGEYVPNKKPEQTLVFAFGEGFKNEKNAIYQALYGEKKSVLFNPNWVDRLERNHLVNLLGDLNTPYKNTEQVDAGYRKIRTEYPLRTVELRVGDIQSTDFNKATSVARVLDSLGYLDTINYLINHELYDPKRFDGNYLYQQLSVNFEKIYKATLHGAGINPSEDPFMQELLALKLKLKNHSPLAIDREINYFIKDRAEKKLDSLVCFSLSRAVEFYHNQLSPEALFKEVYEMGFNKSPAYTVSKITGKSIIDSTKLHFALQDKNMFSLYANKPKSKDPECIDKIFQTLNELNFFKKVAELIQPDSDVGLTFK